MLVLILLAIGCLFLFLATIKSNTQLLLEEKNTKIIKALGHELSNNKRVIQVTHNKYTSHTGHLDMTCKDMHFRVLIEQNDEAECIEVTYQLNAPKLPEWFELKNNKDDGFELTIETLAVTFGHQNMPTTPNIWPSLDKIAQNKYNDLRLTHDGCSLAFILANQDESMSVQDIVSNEIHIDLFGQFVDFCEALLKQIPKDTKTFYLELLGQDDVQHPTFKMALASMLREDRHHPLVMESFDRAFDTMSNVVLFNFITSHGDLELLEDRHVAPTRLLSFINMCGRDADLKYISDYCKSRCIETITVRDIEMIGPEQVGARDYVLRISLKQPEKLEMIAECSVKWLPWIDDRPEFWIATLVKLVPDYCRPEHFLKLIDVGESNTNMSELCIAFMTLIKPSPKLAEDTDWAKVSALLVPHLPRRERKAVLAMLNIHAPAKIYPMLEEAYDKSLPKLKLRFEKHRRHGGISLSEDARGGELSITTTKPGDMTMTDKTK